MKKRWYYGHVQITWPITVVWCGPFQGPLSAGTGNPQKHMKMDWQVYCGVLEPAPF
ncbi:hypothetical protein ALP91_02341 [Pseudomonas savastanoi pv. glycinea]|nr:hypothetical protein ALP91_02341 [Pseudomonas savastanoi pv. glycinea]